MEETSLLKGERFLLKLNAISLLEKFRPYFTQ
jgi:hypothetical protein